MQVTNTQFLTDLSFDQYQQQPGRSFSDIKSGGQQIAETAKMRLGTLVHNYLLEPAKYTHERREVVLPITLEVKTLVGDLLPFVKTEVSVLSDFAFDGFLMKYRGRVDMIKVGRIVIDLKVSEEPLEKTIPYFGYDNQVGGYCLASGCRVGIIIRANPKTQATETKLINPATCVAWWQKQVLKYGRPIPQQA